MVLNHFEKSYQKVPIKIGIGIAIGFVSLIFFIGGGKPPMKKMIKTKPMAMPMPMPILIGTFLYFFQKGSAPSSLAPFTPVGFSNFNLGLRMRSQGGSILARMALALGLGLN